MVPKFTEQKKSGWSSRHVGMVILKILWAWLTLAFGRGWKECIVFSCLSFHLSVDWHSSKGSVAQ